MQAHIGTFPTNGPSFCPIYTMKGRNNLTASILPLGAVIQKLAVLEGTGEERHIVMGFPRPEPYENLVCSAGAVLGPNAGRIRDGHLSFCGEAYALTPNDGPNQLHGGTHSLSSQLWTVEDFSHDGDRASILLSAIQSHGLDGWPGKRSYTARYTLTDNGTLTLEYTARTDQSTYFNLSNHTYWNLSGDFSRSALEQELTVEAGWVCINDGEHLPVDLIQVERTAFDFRRTCTLGHALRTARDTVSRAQLDIARGFNHAYLLDGGPGLKRACSLRDPESGRVMELFTDAPGVVMYSGGFLPEGLELNGSQRSVPSCAVALEAQDLPDCSRLFPSAFRPTLPGEVWQRVIQYRFQLPQ